MLADERSETEAHEGLLAEQLAASKLRAAELEEMLTEAKQQFTEAQAEANELREYAQESAENLLATKDEVVELKVLSLPPPPADSFRLPRKESEPHTIFRTSRHF